MARTFSSFEDLKTALSALGPEDLLPAVSLTKILADDILGHDPVNRKIRQGNLIKLKREIEAGHWDPRKSPALRFLPSLRLADGQHRCRAVSETGTTITVSVCVIPDTVGVDEGAGRTLVDHMTLGFTLADTEAGYAAGVVKALHQDESPGNREWLEYFRANQDFVLESVRKPLAWLSEQHPNVALIWPPARLTVMRAVAIRHREQPVEEGDQLLYDAINQGATAPEGSARRALAKQLFDAMADAQKAKRGPKRRQMIDWIVNALTMARAGTVRNIMSARSGQKRKARRPMAGAAA